LNTATGLIISRGWMSVCGFVTFILVARNLSLAEFGVFALASSAAILPQMLVGAGFYEHVISRDPKGALQRVAETWTIVCGIAGALVVLALAGVAYLGFHSPMAATLLVGFSGVSLLWGFSVIREAVLIRDGRGGAVASVLFAAETVGLVALMIAFYAGAGVYALIAGRIANAIVTLIGFGLQTRLPYRFEFDIDRAREMFRYSGGATGARLVRWVRGRGIDLVVGLVMSLSSVGLFRMGMRLFFSGSTILLEAPQAAILKYLGQAHARGDACMRRTTVRVYRLHAAIVAPIFVGAATIAGVFVHSVLGQEWAASGDVFAILCLSAPAVIAMGVNESVMMASGRSNALFIYQIGATVFAILALLLGALGGPVTAAIARVAMGVAIAVSAGFIMQQEIGKVGRNRFLSALGRIMLATGCMAVWSLSWVQRISLEAPLWRQLEMVAFAGISGLAIYAAALFIFDRPSFRLLRVLWRLMRRPRRREVVNA